jgi:hypothetical protein
VFLGKIIWIAPKKKKREKFVPLWLANFVSTKKGYTEMKKGQGPSDPAPFLVFSG